MQSLFVLLFIHISTCLYQCVAENSIKEIDLDFQVPIGSSNFEFTTTKDHNSSIICYIDLFYAKDTGPAKFDATDSKYNFNGHLCTHLVLYYLKLSSIFEIVEDNLYYDEIKKFQSIKQEHPHLKLFTYIQIEDGDEDTKMEELLSSRKSRQNFVVHIKTTLRKLFLDGVVLNDGMYYYGQQKFKTLAIELEEEFKTVGLLVAVQINISKRENLKYYWDIAEISRFVDFVFVTAYHFNSYATRARYGAPLYSKEMNDENIYDNLKALLTNWQMSRRNLILEVFFGGYELFLKNKTDTNQIPYGFDCETDSKGSNGPWGRIGHWGYDEICTTMLSENKDWKMYWDDRAKVPFVTNALRWITFDNERSIILKTKFVNDLGLRGIAVDAVGYDDVLGRCSNVSYPFLKTINYVFGTTKSERGSKLCSLFYENNNTSIKYEPILSISTYNLKVAEGGSADINCTVEASSRFKLTWFKAGYKTVKLQSGGNFSVRTVELKGDCGIDVAVSILTIKGASSTDYFCKASSSNTSATKTIHFKIEIQSLKPLRNLEVGIIPPAVKSSSIAIWIAAILFLLLLFSIAMGSLAFVASRKQKNGRLTKAEIVEFRQGGFHVNENCDLTQVPDNDCYDDRYELPNNEYKIDKMNILGVGAFGVVFGGQVKGVEVAVKTTRPGTDKQYLKSLLSELKILIYIGNHPQIVNLIGAVTTELTKGILYVFVELCPLGNLQDYLRKSREGFTIHEQKGIQENVITLAHLFKWSLQISKGMCHLSSKNLIHGDLAARNVLLYDKDIIKITDFGLSRKLYQYATYAKKNQEPLPWRWMAIESLRDFKFSIQSDVWSFGVTIWEIFSLGETPYPGMSWSCNFVDQLKQNIRLQKPEYATDALYNIMLECWKSDPKERPDPQKNLESISVLLLTFSNDGYLKNDEMEPKVNMECSNDQ